jgi:hypothetical protein
MTEAVSVITFIPQLRSLFCTILEQGGVIEVMPLFEQFKNDMACDFIFAARQEGNTEGYTPRIQDLLLYDFKRRLPSKAPTQPPTPVLTSYGLPEPIAPPLAEGLRPEVRLETSYDSAAAAATAERNIIALNADQRTFFNAICDAIAMLQQLPRDGGGRGSTGLGIPHVADASPKNLFFLDAPGE